MPKSSSAKPAAGALNPGRRPTGGVTAAAIPTAAATAPNTPPSPFPLPPRHHHQSCLHAVPTTVPPHHRHRWCVGVVTMGVARHVGVALRRFLHAVRGGGGGSRHVHGDGLEVAATGLCAARWRRRQRGGVSGLKPNVAAGGGQGTGRGGVVDCVPTTVFSLE
ncbi:hypothetical protein EDB86DRAFT_2836224 [Lactarius hatsudake]|nr:hypothetical protein EDB86DRAFT_2836224 [Lactarius hatsudake]